MRDSQSVNRLWLVCALWVIALLLRVCKADDFECELPPKYRMITSCHTVAHDRLYMNFIVPSNLESRHFAFQKSRTMARCLINADGLTASESLVHTVTNEKSPLGSGDTLFLLQGGVPATVYGRNHFYGMHIGINQEQNRSYLSEKSRLPVDTTVKTMPLDTKFGDLRCNVTINGREHLAKIEFDLEQSLAMTATQFQEMFPDESSSDGVRKLNHIHFFDTEISDVAVLMRDDRFAPISIGFDLVRRLQSEFLFEPEKSRWQFVPQPAYVMPNRFRFDFDASMTGRGLRIDAVYSWGIAVGHLRKGDILKKINGVPVHGSLICILEERVAEVIATGGRLNLIRDRYPKEIMIKAANAD
jgi:hypothetical protein